MSGGSSTNPFDGLSLPKQVSGAYTDALGLASHMPQTLADANSLFTQMGGMVPSDVTAGQIRTADIDAYKNPYTAGVINTTMDELNRQEAMQRTKLGADAAQGGYFGGDRFGVEAAEQNRNFDMLRKDAIANLYNQNFMQAQNAAKSDIDATMSADMANQQMRAGMFPAAATGKLALSGAGGNMATILGQLAESGFGMGKDTVNQNLISGGMMQQLQQDLINAAKGQYTGLTNAPSSAIETLFKSLGTLPSGIGTSTTTTKAPGKSPLAGIGSGLQMAGTMMK